LCQELSTTYLETKLDILKFIHQDQRSEIQYRREREYRIFTWSSSLLSALIGALLITKQIDIIWRSYGIWGNSVASAAVLLIVIYSVQWHSRNSRFRGQNAQVISHIDILLHCHDKGYFTSDDTALFPDEWGDYGRSMKSSAVRRIRSRLLAANYTSATVMLGALAVIMIWLP
jgi:hypothetical protein